MLGFFFKKNFYEGWDNVMFFIVPNLILDAALLLLGIPAFFVTKMPDNLALAGIIIWAVLAFFACVAIALASLSWAELSHDIVNYGVPELKDFFKFIKSSVKDAFKFGALCFVVLVITVVGAAYYFTPYFKGTTTGAETAVVESSAIQTVTDAATNLEAAAQTGTQSSFIGLLAGFVFCWIALSIFMALFWYPALRSFMHNPFGKSIKKCFILLFDNLAFSVVLGLYNVFLFLISIVMLGVAPGMAGIGLARENALYLLMKKYDYLEELDKAKEPVNSPKRRRIPWRDLLAVDIENTGTKGFKGFFMPWKELEDQGAKTVAKKQDDIEEDEKWREE